jgi:hypothetical protein
MTDPLKQIKNEGEGFDENIKAARQISRNTVYRLILLSSGIVGFSVSFFSIPALQNTLNTNRLRISWYLFLLEIITGVLILFLAGRIRYGKTWKNYQPSSFLNNYKDYSAKEKFFADLIVLFTLIIPGNLVYNKICTNENDELYQRKVNGLVVHKLARLEANLITFLENCFLLFFVIALIFLVFSFKI